MLKLLGSKYFNHLHSRASITGVRLTSSKSCGDTASSGLVIGVYDKCEGLCEQEFTKTGEGINEDTNGLLKELLKKRYIPFGKAELFSGIGVAGMRHLVFASLGPKNPNTLNYAEQLNEEKENIRIAMGVGARMVQDEGANKIFIDPCTNPEAAAEGSILATYKYKANLTSGDRSLPTVSMFGGSGDKNSWASGEINAECQNWVRFLSHSPPNFKLPSQFANEVLDKLCKFDVRVDVRNRDWMVMRKMTSTLSLIKGMCVPPLLLEMGYCGDDISARPIVMLGKATLFDSGGLFLKPFKGLHEFRSDMAGAAAICGAIMGAARKRLPINIRAAILLYQNMPSPMGLKPGDVVKNLHGMHIKISDPDNDCRIVLADLVDFASFYSPSLIINVGTFTKSSAECLGLGCSAAFASDNGLWNELQRAGIESGDRLWRFPFWKHFDDLNKDVKDVDIDNGSSPKGGDLCQAAMFTREFVPLEVDCCCPQKTPFIHIDCYNTGLISQTREEIDPYYRQGYKMGRPTRALIQFMYHRACLLPKVKEAVKESHGK